MTSLRQIEANRRNALKSTGPRTEQGKARSRRNAVRHGLTAETVVDNLEDPDDYQAFEAAIIADFDAQTAIDRELALRLAALLWRIRRATAIETELFRIQAEVRSERRYTCGLTESSDQPLLGAPLRILHARPKPSSSRLRQEDGTNIDAGTTDEDRTDPVESIGAPDPSAGLSSIRELAHCFLRLTNFDNGIFDRLGRYEAGLWRQIVQTLFVLQSAQRHR